MPMETKVEAKAETKEVNAKAGMVEASKSIVEQLTKLGKDVEANVLPPQGQAALMDYVNTALDRMTRMVTELGNMPESDFAMVPAPAKEKGGHQDAKGHQSR